MDIIAFVKRVPTTTMRVVVKDSVRLDPTGVEYELNPYDEFAVEEGLKQRDAAGSGSLTAVCFGPAEAQKELRKVLAMGADAALLLENAGANDCDAMATASVIADAVRDRPHQLLLFGKQAVDRDQHGVGPAVATLLGIPCITEVVQLTIEGGEVVAEREVEGAREVVRAPLPCAVTCQKGLNEPRFPSLKGIMAAKKKPMETVAVELPAATVEIVEMTLPAPRDAGEMLGEGAAAVPALVDRLRNKEKVL